MVRCFCLHDNQKHCCGTVSCFCGCCLFPLSLIFFFAGGYALNAIINQAVSTGLVVNTNTIAQTSFLVSTVNYYVYVFNITNAADVQRTGAQPILKELGPYQYSKITTKFNVSLSDDLASVKYNSWTQYVPVTGNTATTDFIITPNPVYLGAIGSAFGSQMAMQAYLSAAAWSSISTNIYQGDANAVLTAMRLFMLPVYYGAVGVAVSGSFNAAALQLQWSRKASGVLLSTVAPTLAGFELATYATALSQPYISDSQAALLLDSSASGTISLRTSTGLATWSAALAAPTSQAAIGIVTALSAAVSGGFASGTQAFQQVAAYIADKLNANSTVAPGYLATCRSAIFGATSVTLPASNSADFPNSWSDLGSYQFGQGLMTRAMLGSAGVSLALLGLPGLTASSEWYAYCSGNVALSGFTSLTLTQSNAMLAIAISATNQGAFLTAVNTLTAVPSTAATFATTYAALLGSISPASWPVFLAAVSDFLFDDVPSRVAHLSVTERLTLKPAPTIVQNDGTMPGNGGVFVRRSVDEVLFGYSKTSPDPLLTLLGTDFNGILGPRYYNQSDYLAKYAAKNANSPLGPFPPQSIWSTFYGGINSPGSIISDLGTQAIVTRADLNQPCPASGDCRVWLQPEIILGQLDGTSASPMHQNDAVVPKMTVFDDTLSYRGLSFVPDSPVANTLKKVPVRRYVMDSTQLQNASINPANAKYRMTEGTGVLPLWSTTQGSPLYMSMPHFMNADALISGRVSGLTPNPALHTSYFDLEPITGKTVNAHSRPQLNWGLLPTQLNRPDITYLSGGKIVMPTMWVDMFATMSDADANAFNSSVNMPIYLVWLVPLIGMALGGSCMLCGCALQCAGSTEFYEMDGDQQPSLAQVVPLSEETQGLFPRTPASDSTAITMPISSAPPASEPTPSVSTAAVPSINVPTATVSPASEIEVVKVVQAQPTTQP